MLLITVLLLGYLWLDNLTKKKEIVKDKNTKVNNIHGLEIRYRKLVRKKLACMG
jgi:hypothetical protein